MVHKVLRIGTNQPGEMGIVCTKGEGAHTHGSQKDQTAVKHARWIRHTEGRRERMLQED